MNTPPSPTRRCGKQKIGVTGLPAYVLNDRYAIVGAQPYEVFVQALEQINKEQS